MSIDSEAWETGSADPLETREIELVRDELVFPSVSFLSHGIFVPYEVLPGATWDIQAKVIDANGTSRFGIEAACSPAWKPDAPGDAGEILHSVTVTSETMLPFKAGQAVIQQALESLNPEDEAANIINLSANQAAAWESKYFVFDTDSEAPFDRGKNQEVQTASGLTVWSDGEDIIPTDSDLTEEQRKQLYLMSCDLASTMTWKEVEAIINALKGLGIPDKVLQSYIDNLL